MHRFHLPPDRCVGDELVLEGREAHHALRVLRLGVNDEVRILDGAGVEYVCRVKALSKASVTLAIDERREHQARPARVTLFQALPKGKVFDDIVQKATELGVHRVVPLLSERVLKQFDAERADHKIDKWRTVAIESIKQCGSPWLPIIESPVGFADSLQRQNPFDLSMVGSLHAGSIHPHAALHRLRGSPPGRSPAVACWVGPEGDFTSTEIRSLVEMGVQPVSLGPLVLRCETAAIYLLSIVNHELSVPGS